MNRLELWMGGLALLLRSRDLSLDQLAERYAGFLVGGEAGHDLVVDLTLVKCGDSNLRGWRANGARSILERQLKRRYAGLPNPENLIRQRLDEGAYFLSDLAFIESLRACEQAVGQCQLVQVSQPGAWFLDENATRGRIFARASSSKRRDPQLDGYFRYLLTLALARRGGGVLHAAAVVDGNSAYLFAGPSGSGKTTIARAAKERGWAVLADDGVIVRDMGPGGLCAFRTPWNAQAAPWTGDFGTSPESAPIRAIFFVEPGVSDRMVKQEPVAGAVRLVRDTYPMFRWLEAMDGDSAFGHLVRLSRHVPCYTLAFTLDCSFLEEIRHGEF